jgi:hypothetical protein
MRLGSRLLGTLAVLSLSATSALAGDAKLQSIDKLDDRPHNAGQGVNRAALDCSSAIPVMLDNTYVGTTVGAPSMVSTYSCSPWLESGPEVVYVLDLPNPTMFTIDLNLLGAADLDLAVLDACDENAGCLIVVDTGVETISPVQGTFYLVVDGYNGAAGPYELVLTNVPLPEPVNVCDNLQQIVPGPEGTIVASGSFPVNGTTCGGENLISSLPCGFYTENGLEDYWELTLLPGASINVSVTSSGDGALWLLDACAEPFTCVAYADDTFTNQVETFSYMNDSGQNQVLILVVDTYGSATCGTYTGTVTVGPPGVIGVTDESWGAVKSRF